MIDSPVMRIELTTTCEGISASLPLSFIRYVLHLDHRSVSGYAVKFKMLAKLKKPLLTSRSSWLYHAWLESFTHKVISRFDVDEFLKEINWPSNEILLTAFFRTTKRRTVEAQPVQEGTDDRIRSIRIQKMNFERPSDEPEKRDG
ncbi:hypothetical protein [Streptosporangium sp. NPDC087985]|uniref:hypothetical protein n=1 Tax=Streptosporangium sp. NPDC087985 TaxID=3366196 RepID=UPI00381FDCE3